MSNIKLNTNDIYNLSAGRKKQLDDSKAKAKKQADLDKFLREERNRNILAQRNKNSFSDNPVLSHGKGPAKKNVVDNPLVDGNVPTHASQKGIKAGGASPTPTLKKPGLQIAKPQTNASFKNVMPEEKEAERKVTAKSLNDYGNIYANSGFKNDIGIYRSNSNDTYIGKKAVNDIPISELTDENIVGLVDKGVFDFEKMEKAGLGALSAYIKTKYMQHNYKLYNSNQEGITDDLERGMKFLSKTKDSAGKSIEGMSRGIVNAGASVVDLFSDNEKVEDFIKNNTVKDDNAYKYEFMPEGQKMAADLIGSSAQLLPVIAANAFVPGAGLALIGTSVYGNSYSDARKKGASEGQAAFNGLLKAAAEVTVEKIAGGIPGLPKGATSKLTERAVRLFSNEYMQKFARVLFEAGGEGTEEVLTYLAEPLIDKLTKIPGAKIDYDIQEVAYNWLGGLVGSVIFGGGAVIAGYDNSPAPEAFANVQKAVNEFKKLAFHNGLNDAKTQKAIDNVDKAVKNASFYNTESQKYEVPQFVAELISAGKTIRRNPNTLEAQELIEKYSGVGNTKVIRNDALKQLLKDNKISRRELAAMDTLAYDLGVNIDFTDDFASDNGGMSIVTLPDGKKFVKASRQVIKGDNPAHWAQDVMDYINNSIRHGKDVIFTGLDGEQLTITMDTAGKARYRNEIQEKGGLKRSLTDDEYALKLRVESHIDEISQVSKGNNRPLEPDRKNHPFAKDGFEYRTAYFEDFDGSYYYVNFSVGHNGEVNTVYNVGQIKKRDATPGMAQRPVQNKSAVQQTVAPDTRSSEKSISQNNRIVNGEYSADGRTIRINPNSTEPFFETVLHESIHAIFKGDGTNFKELTNNLYLAALYDEETFGDIRKDIFERYKNELNGNEAHDNKLLYEEFTAKMLSVMLDNPQTLKSLARKNMNVFQKLYDSIVGFFDGSIKRYIEKDNSSDSIYDEAIQKLEDYRDKFLSAFEGELDGYYRGNNVYNETVKYDKNYTFNKQVDDALSNNIKRGYSVFVGNVPNLLVKCGLNPEYPMLMSPSHIRDVNHEKSNDNIHYHDISKDIIKQVPVLLKNPAMIYDSVSDDNKENSICVLTTMCDKYGDPIVIIVSNSNESNKYLNVEMETIKVSNSNHIDTLYGKEKFLMAMNDVLNKDAVLYVSSTGMNKLINRKNIRLNSDGKLQLLARLDNLMFDSIIRRSRNIVNVKNNQNSASGTGSLNNMSMKSISNAELSEDVYLHQSTDGNNRDIDNTVPYSAENRNTRSKSIFIQGRKQYGLEPDVVYGDDTPITQSAIDERLGRSFNIPDENTLKAQTDYKDMKNNSLHYSDNVVFSVGEGAETSYGTGRILDFIERGDTVNAIVSVDSGDFNSTELEVSADKLIFTSHNNNETISEDFASSNSMYARAKAAYDSQLLSNNENIKGFSFSDAQYYLTISSERLGVLTQKIKSRRNGYDEGIATSHNLDPSSEDFEFDRYTQYELGLQLYDAVRNYNMARKVSEIYTSRNYEFVGLDEAIDFIHDIGHLFSLKSSVVATGSYDFNTVYHNFERVMGNYYDVLGKPLLDNFDRAKGNYSRGIFSKGVEVTSLYKKCGIEIGSIEDAAVQMLGEGEVHFNLKNKKHKNLFKEMGFNESFTNGDTADISFNMQVCSDIFGEEKALQIKECADYFRAMYDEYLTRANEVIARIYPGQEQRLIHPRKDYFRHFSEIAEGLYGVAQIIAQDIQIDPKLVGKTDRTKPKISWESIWQVRTGKTTDYSAFKGFADYIPHAEYTININPFIKEFREFGQLLADAKARRGQTDLNSFINYIDKFSNHLAKKTIGTDRIFTDIPHVDLRRLLNVMTAANNHIMKNSILLNASVSIKQILNLKNGIIYLQKPSLLVNSTMGLLKAYTADEKLRSNYESLMDKSDYLAERFLNEHFADRKSGARRLAEKAASIGDEFAVRAIWLAAYEDGKRLKCDDAVRYADDIARRCSAGRGIGEKPLAFTQQTSKLILPFLLENNNNWNVLRDAFGSSTKTRKGSTHEFSDTNSYSYYKNQKSSKFMSNSFRILMYFLATAGIGELIEELTGSQAEFNPLKDIFNGVNKAIKGNDEFDFEALCDGIGNATKNLGTDFAEHRNFSWAYSALLSFASDNPLSAKNDFFGSVPVMSAIVNPLKKAFKDKDYIGAGLDLTTSFVTPFGGNQIKKSINGAVDFFQGGNYKNAPTKQLQNSILRKFDRGGAIRGEKQYEIEKTPGNFARGFLFGQSSFPEAQEYYESKNEGKNVDEEQLKLENDAFTQFRKKAKTPEYDEFFRVWDNTDNYGALPYRYISPTLEFTSESGKEYSVELTEEQVKKYQDRYNREAKKKYLEVSKTDEYKKASDTDKAKLLSNAGSVIWKSLSKDMQNDAIGDEFVKEYTSKFGDDEIIKAYKRSGYNSDYVPHYEFSSEREFTLNGVKTKFTLSNDELTKYTELADEEIRNEFQKIVSDPLWKLKDNEKRAAALSKAKEKVVSKIGEYMKYDYIYKDAMEDFDAVHGEDNPVKKAYDYSHDASVYPYWELDSKIKFQYKKQDYEYELSDKELYTWMEYYNGKLVSNFTDNAISGGYTKGKSDEELYDFFTKYKKEVRDFLNIQLKNYAKAKLGFSEATFE